MKNEAGRGFGFGYVQRVAAAAAGAGLALVLDVARSGEASAAYPVAATTITLFRPFALSPSPVWLISLAVLFVAFVATAVARPTRLHLAFFGGFVSMAGVAFAITLWRL